MVTRRQFVRDAAVTSLLATLPGVSLAAAPGETRLIVMILRGALDGLQAVPAVGDRDFAAARGMLADPAAGVRRLDDLFGLHPSLEYLHTLYERKQFTAFHAVATPYRERSHFDAQDLLENGTPAAHGARDGWLNRALLVLQSGESGALALGQNVPLILRGEAAVSTWAPSRLPGVASDLVSRLGMLYADDELLARRLEEALSTDQMAGAESVPSTRRDPLRALESTLTAVARFLVHPNGPRVAVLDSNGWDTHANEVQLLSLRLRALDRGFLALERELGAVWNQTAVLVITEFGRTVAINGSRGTDHGTGTVAFLFGGAVNGGRIVADWPGLAPRHLHESRDLKPTLDLRAICKGLLVEALQIDPDSLSTRVFPGSASVAPLSGLLRTS